MRRDEKLGAIVAFFLILLLAAIVVPAINAARLAVGRIQHANDLKAIGLALHNYHDAYQQLPPAYVLGPDEKPWHSWRVLILPYLGYPELYKEYRFDEPWDGPRNRLLLTKMPKEFGGPRTKTPYVGIVAYQTAWPGQYSANFSQFLRGTANTVALLQDDRSDIDWLEPRDLSYRQAAAMNERSETNPYQVLMMDGSVKSFQRLTDKRFATYVCVDGPLITAGGTIRGMPADFFGDGKTAPAVARDAEAFHETVVHASNRQPLEPTKSALWCATLQMTWDEIFQQFPTAQFNSSTSQDLIDLLNNHRFPKASLTDGAEIQVAHGRDAGDKLHQQMVDKFGNLAANLGPTGENDITIISSLEKHLAFKEELEEVGDGVLFSAGDGSNKKVVGFGLPLGNGNGLGKPIFTDTIFVRDYISDDDFVLEFATKGKRADRIILARQKPAASLWELWNEVRVRIAMPNRWHDRPHVTDAELLHVPVIDLSITKQFDELEGATSADGWTISKALQLIKLRLDRRGSSLISLAEMGLTIDEPGDVPPPKKVRYFTFDAPFLMAMIEADATEPYFLAWIATPEVMIPFEE